MRLIDADELEKTGVQFETHGGATFIALGNVRSAPTIAPSTLRPKGEWIEQEDWNVDDYYYTCSVCKEDFVTVDGTPSDNLWNFCPNCGADMRGDT